MYFYLFIRNKVVTFAPKLWNRFSKVSWFLSKIEYGIIPNGLTINLIYMAVRRRYFVLKVKFLQIFNQVVLLAQPLKTIPTL